METLLNAFIITLFIKLIGILICGWGHLLKHCKISIANGQLAAVNVLEKEG